MKIVALCILFLLAISTTCFAQTITDISNVRITKKQLKEICDDEIIRLKHIIGMPKYTSVQRYNLTRLQEEEENRKQRREAIKNFVMNLRDQIEDKRLCEIAHQINPDSIAYCAYDGEYKRTYNSEYGEEFDDNYYIQIKNDKLWIGYDGYKKMKLTPIIDGDSIFMMGMPHYDYYLIKEDNTFEYRGSGG